MCSKFLLEQEYLQQNPTHTLMFDEGLEADTAAELADGLEAEL